MSSIIEGYNYDIFISYRQKDNKGDHWVTEFVEALKTELESTFKEEISVYFDINPHDGLLETHDVSESLKEKLKCLIFIPIISRTYCDPKSFAWKHEFSAFVDMGMKDRFGLKIKLPGGNIAKRVLPVRIHDLEKSDLKQYEQVLGDLPRSVDFVYKSAGVNRPLSPKEENPAGNINKTFYRDQINKVAISIKEIINGMKADYEDVYEYVAGQEIIKSEPPENSIIVLPFDNLSSDPEQEYFSDGLTEEIITDLTSINDLLVISRSSAMTFKKSNKKIKDIAFEVNVKYILEGSIRKAGNNIKIIAQLINAENDTHLWAQKYNGTLDDVFDIQEKVSQSIADALKIRLSSAEKVKISERLIDDAFAYDLYLRARREMSAGTESGLKRALEHLNSASNVMGENVILLKGMAEIHLQYFEYGIKSDEETLNKVEEYTERIKVLNPNSAEVHYLSGRIERFRGSVTRAIPYLKKALEIDPNHWNAMLFLASAYGIQTGKAHLAEPLLRKLRDIDPLTPLFLFCEGYIQWMDGKLEKAVLSFEYFMRMEPEGMIGRFIMIFLLAWKKDFENVFSRVDRMIQQGYTDIFSLWAMALKFALEGEKKKALNCLTEEAKKYVWNDPELNWFGATVYALINEKNEALTWLEHSIERGWINYPVMSENTFFENIRSNTRFKNLMARIKYDWENFED